MNPKITQQLVHFLSTTIAVPIGAILAHTYIDWEEKRKAKQQIYSKWKAIHDEAMDSHDPEIRKELKEWYENLPTKEKQRMRELEIKEWGLDQ